MKDRNFSIVVERVRRGLEKLGRGEDSQSQDVRAQNPQTAYETAYDLRVKIRGLCNKGKIHSLPEGFMSMDRAQLMDYYNHIRG